MLILLDACFGDLNFLVYKFRWLFIDWIYTFYLVFLRIPDWLLANAGKSETNRGIFLPLPIYKFFLIRLQKDGLCPRTPLAEIMI